MGVAVAATAAAAARAIIGSVVRRMSGVRGPVLRLGRGMGGRGIERNVMGLSHDSVSVRGLLGWGKERFWGNAKHRTTFPIPQRAL